ncbi:MAG: flagellar hook-length control protein FliK [Lachnospiraceae bacterium]|nr:flagellar hook-length control protein FliK [Lachnospiraceae bacterium]
MIKAPIGGPDILQIQNISPAVQKPGQDSGSDFRQAFESAKDTASEASGSTKVNRTEGTGAGGKDSGAAGQTANDSKVKQNTKEVTADKKTDAAADNNVKEAPASEGTVKTEAADKAEAVVENDFDSTEISLIAEKLILDIASLLGITPGELSDVLSDMGIEAADLMVSENINLLVADVKGGGDLISLAADADLMELANQINTAVTEAGNRIAEMIEAVPEETVKEIFGESLEKAIVSTQAEAADINVKTETVKNDAAPVIEEGGKEETVTAGDLTIQRVTPVNEGEKENTPDSSTGDENRSGRTEIRETREYHEDVNFTRIDVSGDIEVRPDDLVKADESLMRYGTNTEEVVEQIMEHMKAQVKTDMGSLEMVLHPASLGNVAVNIANTANGVTAQFAVQNEAVKEAIEAQIVVFKENLEEQGVKVEAVEVSVASHGFEENLEQGNDQNDAEDSERERLRKATRNIDLGAFGEEVPEDLDEAENLTVDMMRSDGNRMNYRV